MSEPRTFRLHRICLLLPLLPLFLCWLILLGVRGNLTTATGSLENIGTVLLFAASCAALGSLVVRGESSGERLLLSFTTGLVLLYAGVFLLGSLHLIYRPLLALICYVPGLFLLFRIRIGRIGEYLAETVPLDRNQVLLWLVACVVWFYSFLCSLSPLTHYDALANHVAIPAEYLLRGGIERIPYNLHADLPPAAHLVFLPILAGAGGDAIQAMGPVLFLFVALALRSLAPELTGWLTGWILFLLVPQVSLLFSLANIDFLTTLFCLVCLLLYLRLKQDSRAWSWILLAAHLAFLVSLKYQAAIFVGLLLALALLQQPRKAILACALFPLFLAPFLVKNYLFTGDPVFPFATAWFHLPQDAQAQATFFVNANSHISGQPSAADYLWAYLRTFSGWPEAGLLPVIAAVALILFRKIESPTRSVLLLFSFVPAAIHVFFSLNLVNLMRWIQYSWACLCLLAALAVAPLLRRHTLWMAGLLLYCALSFFLCFKFNMDLTQAILVGTGRMSAEEYRIRYIPSFKIRSRMTTLEGKILFLGDARGYYNVENSIIPSDYNNLYYMRYFDGVRDANDLNARLKKDSIRYLFLNIRGITTGLKNGRHAWLAGRNLLLLQEVVRQGRVVDRDSTSLLVELR